MTITHLSSHPPLDSQNLFPSMEVNCEVLIFLKCNFYPVSGWWYKSSPSLNPHFVLSKFINFHLPDLPSSTLSLEVGSLSNISKVSVGVMFLRKQGYSALLFPRLPQQELRSKAGNSPSMSKQQQDK